MRGPTRTYSWPVSRILVLPLVTVAFALACVWAVFWIIRLGVRYGVNDAIRMNPALLAARPPAPSEPQAPTDR